MESENLITCTHTSPTKIALYIGVVIAFFLGGAILLGKNDSVTTFSIF